MPSLFGLAGTFGAAGSVLGLVRALPQLVRLLRAREAYGVSVDTAATSAIVSSGWVVYAILTGQPLVMLATATSAVIFALIAFFALRYGRRVSELKITPVWLAVLLLAGIFAGKNGLGLLLPVSVLVANLPQLWVAYHEGNLADLSLGTWLLSMTDGLVWGAYALLQGDIPILFYAMFQLATSGLIVGLKQARRAAHQA
jgi:uncharacterized protein with PQ loop repeat